MVSVGTCPLCLPVGSITWLIENGRQLEIFSELPEPVRIPGVLAFGERDGPTDPSQVTPDVEDVGLPF